MRCEDLKLELPLYSDNALPSDMSAAIGEHLVQCPLCRQELADLREIRNGLRRMRRPVVPAARLMAIRRAVSERARAGFRGPAFELIEPRGKWLDRWLMPYTVGSVASLLLGLALLWLILLPVGRPELAFNGGLDESISGGSAQQLLPPDLELIPTQSQYASTRLAIARESPSLNPHGALVALSRSLIRGEMSDEEVVVVADVFGDGLARIAQVVEPSSDDGRIRELHNALQSDPAFAPFVPADLDHRSESVRVVLRVHTVKVQPEPDNGSR